MRVRAFVAIVLLSCVAGCTTRLADLTFVAYQELDLAPEVVVRGLQGIDCAHSVLLIPLGRTRPSLEEALRRVLAKVPGANSLVNVEIDATTLFTFFYNRSCLKVRADAVRIR